jgi:hypothetical protein
MRNSGTCKDVATGFSKNHADFKINFYTIQNIIAAIRNKTSKSPAPRTLSLILKYFKICMFKNICSTLSVT